MKREAWVPNEFGKLVRAQRAVGDEVMPDRPEGKMRNPARIKVLLNLLEQYWDRPGYSDLRLAQIIGNFFPGGDTYYVEDEALIAKLEEE